MKVSKTPFTYINRLKLKNHLKKTVNARISCERTFTVGEEKGKKGFLKSILFLFMIIAAIVAIRFTGISSYLEQETLRGKLSLTFIIGLSLVILVSLIPLIYKRYSSKKI